jgi:hypothetical protein
MISLYLLNLSYGFSASFKFGTVHLKFNGFQYQTYQLMKLMKAKRVLINCVGFLIFFYRIIKIQKFRYQLYRA